jgi:hypothetical protein
MFFRRRSKQRIEWDRPIFIVSAGRSGSVMLSDILNTHPQVAITNEANIAPFFWIMHRAARLELFEAERVQGFQLRGLINDRYRDAFSGILAPRLFEVWQEFHRETFSKKKFTRWGDKFQMAWVVQPLIEQFPKAQFVHLVRDGRDRTVSAIKFYERARAQDRYGPEIDFEQLCKAWVLTHQTLLDVLTPAVQSLSIRYEDLIQKREQTLAGLYDFLDLPFETKDLGREPVHSQEIFARHGTSSTPQASLSRWQSEMDVEQQQLAHDIMGNLLREFGYPIPAAFDTAG